MVKINLFLMKYPEMMIIFGWSFLICIRFGFTVLWDLSVNQQSYTDTSIYYNDLDLGLKNNTKSVFNDDFSIDIIYPDNSIIKAYPIMYLKYNIVFHSRDSEFDGNSTCEDAHDNQRQTVSFTEQELLIREAQDFSIKLSQTNDSEVPSLIFERLITRIDSVASQIPDKIQIDFSMLKRIIFTSLKNNPTNTFWIGKNEANFLNPANLQHKKCL